MNVRRFLTRGAASSTGLAAAILASVVLSPSVAVAQEPLPGADQGPRFGQWGPGRPAPAAEGPVGTPPPGLPAPRPGGLGLPPPSQPPPQPQPNYWNGCNYGLSGAWEITGRQDVPYYRAYSTTVSIQQYGNWIQVNQPDAGYTYYGQCNGNNISLDVYQGSQFIGYENGFVDWSGGVWNRWGGPRIRANWRSYLPTGTMAGTETWHRQLLQ
jgi:hypothetical protein